MTLRLASSALGGNHTDMINRAKRMLVDQIISAKRSNINIHLQWVDIWLKKYCVSSLHPIRIPLTASAHG